MAEVLRKFTARTLPGYMIPSYFIEVDKIPRSVSGKIVGNSLPLPQEILMENQDVTAPRNPLEKKLAGIWAEVLFGEDGLDTPMGIDKNFFEMGGHSLKAITLLARIKQGFDVNIPLATLFEIATIRELAAYMKDAEIDEYQAIEPVEKKEYYSLSPAQERLYILQQLTPGGTVYNMPMALPLENPAPIILERTFRQLIKRHDSLRTSFQLIDEKPVQVIHDAVPFQLDYFEVDATIKKNQTPHHKENNVDGHSIHHLTAAVQNRLFRSFDLTRAPLLRAALVTVEDREKKYLLLVDMHHIIADGVSLDVLQHDFAAYNEGNRMPSLKLQYKDYSQWLLNEKEKGTTKKQETYWLKQFEGEIPVLDLPLDYPRPPIQRFEGDWLDFNLSGEELQILKTIALADGATMFMVLLSILNTLLAKLGNPEDIIVGTPVAGRRHADLEKIIGMFVNTLALRNFPKDEKPFKEFLTGVKARTLDAFENQEYQFEELVKNVSVNRDTGRNPLFDVMFSLQTNEGGNPQAATGKKAPAQAETGDDGNTPLNYDMIPVASKFDMTLTALESTDNIDFNLTYNTALFKKETAKRFAEWFKRIVSRLLSGSDKKLSEIDIIALEEKKKLLYDFNDTRSPYLKDKTIPLCFEEQVAKTPGSDAVVYDEQRLTYQELNLKSNRLANVLKEKGIKTGSIAGILVERSLEMIVGIMAILKAGGAYLPISPSYPPDRMRFMLEDSGSAILVTDKKTSELPDEIVKNETLERIDLNEKNNYNSSGENTVAEGEPGNPAYVIYTSGSTGTPKGVMVEHRHVINLVHGLEREIYAHYNETLRVGMVAPYVFDASVQQIFAVLFGGHSLYILPEAIRIDGRGLWEFYGRNKIEITDGTQAHLRLMTAGWPGSGLELNLGHLIIGGEALHKATAQAFLNLFPGLAPEIVNIYGPAECCVDVSSYTVTVETVGSCIGDTIPIGKPMLNRLLYIVDKSGNHIQPVGVPGELHISGEGIARGYINNPTQTDERFKSPHPTWVTPGSGNPGEQVSKRSGAPKARVYSSGDLCRWLEDGNIEFLGRIDSQVKIRGYRIELGEIEHTLTTHTGVREAVVMARNSDNYVNDKYLCAYVVPDTHNGPDTPDEFATALRRYLSSKLPDYMVPVSFTVIENIPLTVNGKIDT
ncbi:MAG: amino acid adenylation domain-containing protein, partial [bacterium]|nr:amino acid adenylation domain-containing protein [bacterium]